MGTRGDWLFIVVTVVVSCLLIVRGRRPISEARLVRWSLRFDVVVDSHSRGWVSRRLRRARMIRWTSFVAGLNISLLPMYMNVIDVDRAASFSNPAGSSAPWAAAALGAVLAEVLVVQRPAGPRVADIARRRWRDYADQRWVLAIVGCLPVAIAAATLATAGNDFRWRWSWVGPASVICAIVAVTVGVHHIVDRPAISATGPERLIDDALRADGAHHILGASVALAGMGTFHSLAIATSPNWVSLLFVPAQYWVIYQWQAIACLDRWNVQRVRMVRA